MTRPSVNLPLVILGMPRHHAVKQFRSSHAKGRVVWACSDAARPGGRSFAMGVAQIARGRLHLCNAAGPTAMVGLGSLDPTPLIRYHENTAVRTVFGA